MPQRGQYLEAQIQCCHCKRNLNNINRNKLYDTILYQLAFTIWHVAFHVENLSQVNIKFHLYQMLEI